VGEAAEDHVLLRLPISRNEAPNRLPDHLASRITEHALGSFIPVLGDTVERLANNGIGRRCHDRGETCLRLLGALACGNVLDGADEADDLSLTPRTLKMNKPLGLHPANLTVLPPEPELRLGSLRLGGIERSGVGRPNLFLIVWMHPIHELFDGGAILGDAENLLGPRIPGKDTVAGIVLPRP
jgi:hypothetical protein